MVNFENTLKTLRLKGNMTQAQLAQKLGLTKSVISAYETYVYLPMTFVSILPNIQCKHRLFVRLGTQIKTRLSWSITRRNRCSFKFD